ncbi:MAG: BspA family leucine-rich repeat surface protein [Bacteroidaceae bacterium]|nr:BspA family leucine-rich repeat surface protein [Bacteroidaceae bacterium]
MKKIKLFLAALLAIVSASSMKAQEREPYAVLSDDGSTLTFYYDNNKPAVGGDISEVYDLPWDEEFPPLWANLMGNSSIVTAEFDKSFADYKPDYTSGMFYSCENLKEIKGIEYLNTENVTSMWGMFYNCSSLETLDLNNFDTGNVKDMGYMFYGCEKLETLDLSSFDTGNVTNMEKMFSGCSNLETIYCNKDWAKEEGLLSEGMFGDCTKLKGGNGTEYDASHIDAAYAHVDVAGNPGYFTEKYAYAVLSEDGKTLTFYYDAKKPAVGGDISAVYDLPWDKEFPPLWANLEGNSSIVTAEFDKSFADYKPDYTMGMFYNCVKLEEIKGIEYLNTENVTSMGYMFYACTSLKTLDLNNFDTGNVIDMERMFSGCSKLETIYCAPEVDWSGVSHSADMFTGCEKLSGKYGSKEFPFDSNEIEGTYAKVYLGNDEVGGYFTSISQKREAYAVLDGSTLTFYYDANKPEEGTVYDLPWTANTFAPWAGKTDITAVEFNESFADYDGLKNLYGMFANLTKVTAITGLDYLNTENVENMAYMFYACTSLESLDVNSFNTEKVTNMTSMFAGCKFTTLYCNKNWAKDGLVSERMFNACTELVGGNGTIYNSSYVDAAYAHPDGGEGNPGYFTEREAYAIAKLNHPEDESDESRTLTFYYDNKRAQRSQEPGVSSTYVYKIPWDGTQPKWTNSGVVSIITAADFDPSFADYKGLTSTRRMFYEMTNLKTIDNLKYLNTQNVTDMSEMFKWCQSVEELDVSNFNTANVTDMNYMFYLCANVEALDVSSFDTGKVEDMSYMFSNCYKVEELDLNNFDTKNVTDMSYMFFCCYALKSLDVSSFDTKNVTDMERMFYSCYALKSLDVSSFDTGKVKDMKSMFSYCKALMSLDVSNFDTGKVKDMSNMFSYCEALEELDLDNFDTEEVTDMSFMFNGCSVLTSLDLSSFNTEKVTSMGSMFASCKNLPMLDVSSFNVKSVTNMNSMFMNCEKLTTIFCLDDWKEMCEAENLNSSYMFSGCNVLKGVVPYNRNNSNDVDFANPTTGYFAPFYDLTVTEAGMATLYLGFQAEIPEDVNAYLCYAEDLTGDNPYALAHKFEDSYLPKETAVFVTAEPGTYRFKYYYVEPGYVINFISNFLDGNILTGTLEEMAVEPHSVLTLGYSNQTNDLGFWWYTGTTIPANRAYIPGDKLPAEVKGIRLLFGDDETGIKTTNLTNQTNEAGAWYTIDGRKLEGKPQQRGLYINNGKKIIIK